MIKHFEHFLHGSIFHLSSLVKCLIQTFCPFFRWFICLLTVNFECSLYAQDTIPSSDICFAKIFSQSVTCVFILLTLCFELQKFFMWMKSQFISVFFYGLWFLYQKISIGLNWSHKDVLLYFLPEILLLGFRFYFFTSHFHLIFVYDAKYRFKFIVFMWISSCFKTIWWKGDPFSTALPLHLCQKSAVYVFVGLLLDSSVP